MYNTLVKISQVSLALINLFQFNQQTVTMTSANENYCLIAIHARLLGHLGHSTVVHAMFVLRCTIIIVRSWVRVSVEGTLGISLCFYCQPQRCASPLV